MSKKQIIIIMLLFLIIASIIVAFIKSGNIIKKDDINYEFKIITEENDISSDRTENVKELKKQNDDIIGWLQVYNTNINYAVVQGQNNEFYMNHDFLKKESENGALFLDYQYDWKKPDTNLLIYGHNKENNLMFSELLKYSKEEFYKKNPSIRFTTVEEDNEYEIISAFYSRVYYKSEKDVFRYYFFLSAENEEDFNNYINNAIKSSIYNTGKTATYGDQLITLSTCSYHTEDGRFAIVAKKINSIN